MRPRVPPQRRHTRPDAEEAQMASKRKVGNLLGLTVLSYLSQPMHPYEAGAAARAHRLSPDG